MVISVYVTASAVSRQNEPNPVLPSSATREGGHYLARLGLQGVTLAPSRSMKRRKELGKYPRSHHDLMLVSNPYKLIYIVKLVDIEIGNALYQFYRGLLLNSVCSSHVVDLS